ncbi:MAG: dipeptidase [Synergistaceae bacterium]|jgi:membrane dipeptidase|nr:dipeptidase [Synergistaceae bacterium]
MRPLIVDAHYDLLSDVFRLRTAGERKVVERFYLDDLKASGINVLICSLFIRDQYLPEMALRHVLDQIGMLHYEMEESPGLFALCRSASEVRKTVEAGQTALLLSFEGVEPIGNDLVLLRLFYELGVRFVGLTWSRRNYAADGCHFRPVPEGSPGGLTAFGVQLLEEAERLGMIVDVSHLNDAGFADVLKFAKKPFIASHSNCRAIAGVMRNLTDAQIEALASKGGVMGLNNMIHFVYPSEDAGPGVIPNVKMPEGKPRYEGFFDHIRHVIELVGPDHIGFGFDLCEFAKPEAERDRSVFPTYRHAVPFIEGLDREFSNEVAAKIRGENWMRIIEALGENRGTGLKFCGF